MAQPDQTNLLSLQHDSAKQRVFFQFSGWQGGHPMNSSGSFSLELMPNQTEEQAEATMKEAVRRHLTKLARCI